MNISNETHTYLYSGLTTNHDTNTNHNNQLTLAVSILAILQLLSLELNQPTSNYLSKSHKAVNNFSTSVNLQITRYIYQDIYMGQDETTN